MSSDLASIGGFECSDDRANKLFSMMVNADRSNFFYFPTDCPHREKNGWTGDASMSADHMVLLYDTVSSWRVWLDNIRHSQNSEGAIPGIIPTAGWGFAWGNGPLWDSVIFNLPYELYKRRAETAPIKENADMMLKYLAYILARRDEDGTFALGLGDWCQVSRENSGVYDAPLKVTDTISVMDMAGKASEMLRAVGMTEEADYALRIYRDVRDTIRHTLVDFDTFTVYGSCQTAQCAALYYGVFDESERQSAFSRLLDFIHEKNDKFDCGLLGLHCIFHVLSDFGYSELAYKMIMSEEYPSYAWLIDAGETAMVEKFMPNSDAYISHNHHFLADISRWFIKYVAGLEIVDHATVRVNPMAVSAVNYARAWYELPSGRVTVTQTRGTDGKPIITVTAPDGVTVIR